MVWAVNALLRMWPASSGFLPQHHLLPPIPPSYPLPNYQAPPPAPLPPPPPLLSAKCVVIIIKQVDTIILSAEAKDDFFTKKRTNYLTIV